MVVTDAPSAMDVFVGMRVDSVPFLRSCAGGTDNAGRARCVEGLQIR